MTTPEWSVEDIPLGCKRISQSISIVTDEKDDYADDDQPLQRVLADPELDVSILKAPVKLDVIPFRIGQSASIRAGNVVQVRGFPSVRSRPSTSGR